MSSEEHSSISPDLAPFVTLARQLTGAAFNEANVLIALAETALQHGSADVATTALLQAHKHQQAQQRRQPRSKESSGEEDNKAKMGKILHDIAESGKPIPHAVDAAALRLSISPEDPAAIRWFQQQEVENNTAALSKQLRVAVLADAKPDAAVYENIALEALQQNDLKLVVAMLLAADNADVAQSLEEVERAKLPVMLYRKISEARAANPGAPLKDLVAQAQMALTQRVPEPESVQEAETVEEEPAVPPEPQQQATTIGTPDLATLLQQATAAAGGTQKLDDAQLTAQLLLVGEGSGEERSALIRQVAKHARNWSSKNRGASTALVAVLAAQDVLKHLARTPLFEYAVGELAVSSNVVAAASFVNHGLVLEASRIALARLGTARAAFTASMGERALVDWLQQSISSSSPAVPPATTDPWPAIAQSLKQDTPTAMLESAVQSLAQQLQLQQQQSNTVVLQAALDYLLKR